LAERVQHEFYATQIEINSRPHTSAGSLREDLVQARQIVAAAAGSAGAMLVASGTSALTGSPLPMTECDRYAAMSLAFPDAVRQTSSEFCGCHVHLGTVTRPEALALSNGLRPWLPVLQALAANSPYCAAGDSGCASSRYFQQRRWPTVGPAPPLVNNAEYEQVVRQLLRDRRILDRGMVYWYARPSEHLPTLEVRIADVNADVDVTGLIAMLLRGLSTMILARLDAGFADPRPVSRRRLVQAHHSAARHGLAGWTVDPVEGGSSPVSAQLSHLLEFARPALERPRNGVYLRRRPVGMVSHR
jgi:carboxylate-amine ligase